MAKTDTPPSSTNSSPDKIFETTMDNKMLKGLARLNVLDDEEDETPFNFEEDEEGTTGEIKFNGTAFKFPSRNSSDRVRE